MKQKLIATCVAAVTFTLGAHAATFTWTDGGDGNWSTNTNWAGGTAPTAPGGTADDIVFGDTGYSSTNAYVDVDYDVSSITFNSETTQDFRLDTTSGTHTLRVPNAFSINAGVTGIVTLAGRLDTTGNTGVANNSATTVIVNFNTSGSGIFNLSNGAFKINGSGPYNSVHSGGYRIDNATLEINGPTNSGTQEGPFGTGSVFIGGTSTSNPAGLTITNIRSKVTTLPNNFVINAPGATLTHNSPQTTFIDGNVTLNEDLVLDNTAILRVRGDISGTGAISAGDSNSALSILVFEGAGNSFTGDFTLTDTAFQGRENNILGNAANVVNLDSAFFRLYVDNNYITNNASSTTITLDNDFVVTSSNGDNSSIGAQGEGGGAFPVSAFTGIFNGNISIDADTTVEIDASTNENFAQTSTSTFTGDITDGANTAGLLIYGGGNAGSTTTVNLNGTITTDGPTSIQIDPDNDDELLYGSGVVNLNGSLSNANITVGTQNTLQGSGTINLNIDGSDYDTIDVEGTLDISGLTIDFNETGDGATLGIYVLADYSAGSLSGATFGTVTDLPTGYAIDYNYESLSQIALVQSSGLFTWDGDTSQPASTATNWVGDVAPTSPGTGTEDLVIATTGYGQTAVNFNVDYTIDSLTFNGNVDSAFRTVMGPGAHKVTVNNIVRDAGADGDITVNGRYTIPAGGTTLINKHATSALTFNGNNSGTGIVTLKDGKFAIKTPSATNSTHGGFTIENAELDVDITSTAGGNLPFGNGPIQLGEVGSSAPASLIVTSIKGGTFASNSKTINVNAPSTYDIDQGGTFTHTGAIVLANDLTLDAGGVHSISGVISGTGNITTQTATTLLTNNSNSFVGDLTVTNVLQLRANNAAGDAANQIIVDGGQFRTFITADASTRSLANPITVSSGTFGGQAQGSTVDTGTFDFDGAITLDSDSILPFIAESNPTNEQALTYNINGAIADGDNTASLQIEGGGFATSSSVVNITGGIDIGGSLILINESNLGTLTTNLNSTASNANLTIGADTTLAGSGTLTYNIDGSTSDFIDNDGTLDITGLTLAISEGTTGATSPVYIIADYGDGTLTGAAFASVTGTPAGYTLDYTYDGTQIALVDGSIAGQIYWDGGGVNNNWSTAGNWVANTAPTQPGTGTEDIYFSTAGNPYDTSVFESDYALNSITFTEFVDSALSINSGGGVHTLTVDTITVDAGAAGSITLNGRYTIPAVGTEIINNSGNTVTANLDTQVGVGTGPVTYNGGAFEISTGSANNAAHDGGVVIENGTVEVNTVDAGASNVPFGTGALLLGEASTIEASTLLLSSVRNSVNTIANDLVVNSPSATLSNQTGKAQTFGGSITLNESLSVNQNANTFLNGAISGSGDLSVSGGAIFVIGGASANTFTGAVTLGSTAQVRKDNGLGNAANAVNSSTSFRLFQETDASTLTLDNAMTFTGGSYGFQALGATVATGTATQNGALTINLNGSFTITAASNVSNVQDLTLNLAAIGDGINTADLALQGGGIAGGDSIINLSGTNTYDGTTTLSRLNDLGTLTVNVNGSQENSNITVGASTTLAGSGTLNWNIGGASANLITVNGTLDISGLTIDFNETSTPTESVYVLADYSAGSLTGASFASEVDLPSGYSIDYTYASSTQIALVSGGSGNDATSAEEFVDNFIMNGSGNPDFSWSGFTGSVYVVERTLDLAAVPIVWTPVYDSGTLGSDQALTYEDTTSFDAAIYRLVITTP